MEKAARLASLAAAGGSLRRLGASLWLRGGQRRWRDIIYAYSDTHYFDCDRNRNLRISADDDGNHAHDQLGRDEEIWIPPFEEG
jgi:hypothetical protein